VHTFEHGVSLFLFFTILQDLVFFEEKMVFFFLRYCFPLPYFEMAFLFSAVCIFVVVK